MSHIIADRLVHLRHFMLEEKIDAFLVNGSDPHLSEYVQDHWKSRDFLAGFTGSYGWIAITQNEAVLWTDSRYYLQAELELKNTGVEMLKARLPETISTGAWLAQRLNSGQTVGFDGSCYSLAEVKAMVPLLVENEIDINYRCDLLNSVWSNRPAAVKNPIIDHPIEFSGESRIEKLARIRHEMQKYQADLHLITALDEVAWTFNLRGSDVAYNPVFMAYAIIENDRAILFLNEEQLSPKLKEDLVNDGITIFPYENFFHEIEFYIDQKVLFDPARNSFKTYRSFSANNIILEVNSITDLMKAVKNSVEIEGFKRAMVADGLALLDFRFWLDEAIKNETITEWDVALKLAEFRAKQVGFMGESFDPIVGYADHGAIVHLHINPATAHTLMHQSLLLFDSGGQYQWGTTDITRTINLTDAPTHQMKTDFTLVLKGMIALSSIRFPHGTLGCHLDVLARKALWQYGYNYGHGTGHGVGAYLNVHEGPMSIRGDLNQFPIIPGMVMSNEPGLYREGEYGIRIENMIVCVEDEVTPFGKFNRFETLTLFPIELELIDVKLLDHQELLWLNAYHSVVYDALRLYCSSEKLELLKRLTAQL